MSCANTQIIRYLRESDSQRKNEEKRAKREEKKWKYKCDARSTDELLLQNSEFESQWQQNASNAHTGIHRRDTLCPGLVFRAQDTCEHRSRFFFPAMRASPLSDARRLCLRCHGQTECDLDRVYARANTAPTNEKQFLSGNF